MEGCRIRCHGRIVQYHAVTNGTDGSPGTDIASQDIWALLNSIDGQLASNGVYHIHIKGGNYTGSATFSPSQDHGYLITGDGTSSLSDVNSTTNGTVLNYTGSTGSAVDTTPNWSGASNQHPFLVFGLANLMIVGKSTNGTLLKLTGCNGFRSYDVSIGGNGIADGVPVSGSVGLSLPSAGNTGLHTFIASSFLGFDTNLLTAADHVKLIGTNFGNAYNYNWRITGGNHLAAFDPHFFNGIGRPNAISIQDDRTPTLGYVLAMVNVIAEGLNGYNNQNGGYYVMLGGGQNNGANGFTISSNLGTGIEVIGGQTTLNGTTAGSAIYSMPFKSHTNFGVDVGSFQKFILFLNGYRNSTGTAQTITWPNRFTNSPAILKDDSGGSTVSTTTLTLPISMGAPVTGWIIIEGY